jgi:hypothetical protein
MNSRTHAAIVLKGTTTRNGPGTCRSHIIQARNQIVCNPQTHLSSEDDIPVVGPRESKPVHAG